MKSCNAKHTLTIGEGELKTADRALTLTWHDSHGEEHRGVCVVLLEVLHDGRQSTAWEGKE
jgi:hypothetical protein